MPLDSPLPAVVMAVATPDLAADIERQWQAGERSAKLAFAHGLHARFEKTADPDFYQLHLYHTSGRTRSELGFPLSLDLGGAAREVGERFVHTDEAGYALFPTTWLAEIVRAIDEASRCWRARAAHFADLERDNDWIKR